MKTRMVLTALVSLILFSILLPPTTDSSADPILKPKKYHGPIPKRAFGFSIGFLGGAENQDLWLYLESLVLGQSQLQAELSTSDFGASPNIDITYTHKMHPNFAFRGRGGATYLSSEQTGQLTMPAPDPSDPALLFDFTRDFKVLLLSLAGSGVYYFQDASVDEFQVYTGLGFGFVFPYQVYEQTLVNTETGEAGPGRKVEEWSVEPEFHVLMGLLYHIRTTLALTAEGRFQIAQSKITLNLPTERDGLQDLNFDVDYTGFVLSIGIAKFF